MNIENFKTNGRTMGYVAHFDVRLDCGVVIRDLTLQRPERFPEEAWLVLPSLERDNRRTVHFPPDLRTEIGKRATMAFAGVSGITLEYRPPSPERRVREEAPDTSVAEAGKPQPKAVISNWLDRHEPDDAGLHRVLAT